MTWFEQVIEDPRVAELCARIERGGAIAACGVSGSSTHLLVAAIVRRTGRPILLVTAHLDDADEAGDELEALGVDVAKFPALEVLPGETAVNLELVAERLAVVRRLGSDRPPAVVAAPIAALMQAVPAPQRLDELHRVVRPGQSVDAGELAGWLDSAGYERVNAIENAGEFAVRGGIIDLHAPGAGPVRIDLFGDEIESLCEIDLDTMGSDRRLESLAIITCRTDALVGDDGHVLLPTLLPGGTIAVLAELLELNEQGRSYLDRVADARGIADVASVQREVGARCDAVVEVGQLTTGGDPGSAVQIPVRPLPMFSETVSSAMDELAELGGSCRVIVLCQNEGEHRRMEELLGEHGAQTPVEVRTHYLHRGLVWDLDEPAGAPALALVPHHELLHRYQMRRRVRRIAGGRAMDTFLDLRPGDYVVHRDHGIARFLGLRTLEAAGKGPPSEYLTLEFSGRSRLNVPASSIELVQKYIGSFKGRPELSTLGGRRWKNQKAKVADAVRDLAADMLRIQASRESMPGVRYPADTVWQSEFEAEFPYQETEDQLAAITAVKKDLMNPRPMDRLLCGDVGFGKTEVAIRAAFKVVEYGRQAAVLVPTTWLAEQHWRTFSERFADYPFRIESLSRIKTGKEQREILKDLRGGQVDIVIGTHRLLSADVGFANLGLVVIDEEQRFGVEHKQRLLALRATADILTMTATPIPRTLHMALLGLRDISSLTTPPLDRRAIVTEVMSFDERRLRHALARELAREGQVFFVHNRVNDIYEMADVVRRMAPEAKIIVGHGQMPPRRLERVMHDFVRGDADILISTTIIESGVDIPTANTMFVNDAHRFGLSELHQLRGRVGRYKHRAYCYLLLDPDKVITEVAMKRLRALESFSMLGAGFKIALRDLEIRGAGNLLGPEQSGHIAAVGYEMYCQLLEQAVGDLKQVQRVSVLDTTVDLGITGTLPRGYIPSEVRRMDAYRRISQADTLESLEQVCRDLESAYGQLPAAAQRLVALSEIRIAAAALEIRSVTRHENDIILRARSPRRLEDHLAGIKGSLRVVGQPDAAGLSQVYYRPPASYLETDTLLTILRRRLAAGERATKRPSDQATEGVAPGLNPDAVAGAARRPGSLGRSIRSVARPPEPLDSAAQHPPELPVPPAREILPLLLQAALATIAVRAWVRHLLPVMGEMAYPELVSRVWGPVALAAPLIALVWRVDGSVRGTGWLPLAGPIACGWLAVAAVLVVAGPGGKARPAFGGLAAAAWSACGLLLLLLGAAHAMTIWIGQCVLAIVLVMVWLNSPTQHRPHAGSPAGSLALLIAVAAGVGQGVAACRVPADLLPVAGGITLIGAAVIITAAAVASPGLALRLGGWTACYGVLLGLGLMSVRAGLGQWRNLLDGEDEAPIMRVAEGFGELLLEAVSMVLLVPVAWAVPRVPSRLRPWLGGAVLLAVAIVCGLRLTRLGQTGLP